MRGKTHNQALAGQPTATSAVPTGSLERNRGRTKDVVPSLWKWRDTRCPFSETQAVSMRDPLARR
jgi:hypothetical protein